METVPLKTSFLNENRPIKGSITKMGLALAFAPRYVLLPFG